ncbi:unnamed protein product, partial [Brassica rapa]
MQDAQSNFEDEKKFEDATILPRGWGINRELKSSFDRVLGGEYEKGKITLRRTKSSTTTTPPRELPCYITSFLTIVILGVGLNAKSWMVYQPQPSPSSDSSPSPTDRFPGITSPETPSNNQ